MSDHRKDLYAALGVERGADDDAIRKAYRHLARRYHPDVNPGDDEAEERFKAISEAYSVLSDAEKRKTYDEFGEVSLEGGFDAEAARRAREAFGARFGSGAPGLGDEEEGFHFGNLDDLFSDVFARRGWSGAPRKRRGPDLRADLELDFSEAALGGERRLTIDRPTADGGVRRDTVNVRIPAGVADGGTIRLRGKGGEGAGGGPAGDLHARVRVLPHPLFRRKGRDLELDVPLSVGEATAGAKIDIPTLDGRVTLTIPPGTDSGTRLRLRGKGVPNPSGGASGDLYAIAQIRVPRDLDPEALASLEGLARFDPPDLRKEFG